MCKSFSAAGLPSAFLLTSSVKNGFSLKRRWRSPCCSIPKKIRDQLLIISTAAGFTSRPIMTHHDINRLPYLVAEDMKKSKNRKEPNNVATHNSVPVRVSRLQKNDNDTSFSLNDCHKVVIHNNLKQTKIPVP